ncbi:M1 family metallopeptidase [Paenibacillus aurantius]|uniref:M1 family metallopeptidase n=1 Tax=Paenibacillus aurantius TaxID=2918900 RepID=A0AA96RD11_9BACL|nr:M1 family metallopeptidase [Paenibacillus aurantius]WNQ11065.1 M1 family metallopeptidase [Paenibacillus aurantius]
MKTLLANRTLQWIMTALAGFVVTLGLYSLLNNPSEPTSVRKIPAVGEPAPIELPPPEPKAPPALSSRVVEYHISVALHPEEKRLLGTQSLTWQNAGSKPVSELYFHLYPNAFESPKTTFNKESGGKLRQDERKADSTGSMELTSIKTTQGEDLSTRMEYVRPDDGNGSDRTLVKIPLLQPVPPGGKITVLMDYTVRMPAVYARMGYAEDFYMAGQWFPKVAVYETAGTRGRSEEGWNLHQYHGNSEFYSDFGIYDVKIKVPAAFTVAATGFPTKPASEENGVKTYRFYADDVHDFAWAASPRFVYYEEAFSSPNVPGVRIKLYLDPKHKDLKNRYLQAAKKSLTRYSEWYGQYPYDTLSIVVPPESGNGAGGMEYPTLVTAWGAADEKPSLELERVVVHEIGHQFFYGMVASNEFEEAWLDEGFTSYAEDKVMEKEYGVKSNLPLEAGYVTTPKPLKLFSWDFGSHHEYADNVYTRAKLVLYAIEQKAGPEVMNRIMKTYFQRWKFKHPSTEDFQKTVEDVTKTGWGEFFDQYVYNGLMADYSVDSIRTKHAPDGGSGYVSEVLIRKRGGQVSPVPIHFHFLDGTVQVKDWDSQANEVLYKLQHTAPVDWVAIDPEHRLILENKHINNFMKTEVDEKWSIRWNVGLSKLIETLLGGVAW